MRTRLECKGQKIAVDASTDKFEVHPDDNGFIVLCLTCLEPTPRLPFMDGHVCCVRHSCEPPTT